MWEILKCSTKLSETYTKQNWVCSMSATNTSDSMNVSSLQQKFTLYTIKLCFTICWLPGFTCLSRVRKIDECLWNFKKTAGLELSTKKTKQSFPDPDYSVFMTPEIIPTGYCDFYIPCKPTSKNWTVQLMLVRMVRGENDWKTKIDFRAYTIQI